MSIQQGRGWSLRTSTGLRRRRVGDRQLNRPNRADEE